MARSKPSDRLLPSLLDRLIDDEPMVSTEPVWAQSQSLEMLKESVQRDIEVLLNTKRVTNTFWEELPEACKSVLTYGLPDLTQASADSIESREWLRQCVERAINHFESRLIDVHVTVLPATEGAADRRLRLRLDARLRVEPNPEPIAFDTFVQPDTGHCQVQTAT